jgi:hypothetical protein
MRPERHVHELRVPSSVARTSSIPPVVPVGEEEVDPSQVPAPFHNGGHEGRSGGQVRVLGSLLATLHRNSVKNLLVQAEWSPRRKKQPIEVRYISTYGQRHRQVRISR